MGGDTYPYAYYRQSTATDVGAIAQREGARYSSLPTPDPSPGADKQYPKPLTEADYVKAVRDSGFTAHIVVGTDFASLRLPPK
jgi:ribonuclease Z